MSWYSWRSIVRHPEHSEWFFYWSVYCRKRDSACCSSCSRLEWLQQETRAPGSRFESWQSQRFCAVLAIFPESLAALPANLQSCATWMRYWGLVIKLVSGGWSGAQGAPVDFAKTLKVVAVFVVMLNVSDFVAWIWLSFEWKEKISSHGNISDSQFLLPVKVACFHGWREMSLVLNHLLSPRGDIIFGPQSFERSHAACFLLNFFQLVTLSKKSDQFF